VLNIISVAFTASVTTPTLPNRYPTLERIFQCEYGAGQADRGGVRSAG
jgi:hypothetical protein